MSSYGDQLGHAMMCVEDYDNQRWSGGEVRLMRGRHPALMFSVAKRW